MVVKLRGISGQNLGRENFQIPFLPVLLTGRNKKRTESEQRETEVLSMGKYHQSKYEQEVVIGFNVAEGTAEIYTADPVWIRKMDKLVQRNPEQFKPGKVETYQGEIAAKRYTFPKRFVTIRSKDVRPNLTDEQRAEIAARLSKGRQGGV
mgnify:CR=1 FL=1